MRSNLMIGLGVLMLIALVFGATLVGQYSGKPDDPQDFGGSEANSGPAIPLVFSTFQMHYDPQSEELARRYFPGFYEVSSDLIPARFWFSNPNAEPVEVTVRGRSCTSCTSARLGVVPAESAATFTRHVATDLALSPTGLPGLLTALSAADMMSQVKYKPLNFDTPNSGVLVPAAPTPGVPTWGILQLDVKVQGIGLKQLEALVASKLGNREPEFQPFKIAVSGVTAFAVDPSTLNVGEMPEGMGDREFKITAYSVARDLSNFPPPDVAPDRQDGFVTVGPARPLTRAELDEFTALMKVGDKQMADIRSAYRIAVVVRRRNPAAADSGQAEPEVGAFNRRIGLSGPAGSVTSVTVTGTVLGAVSVVGGGGIDLKDFDVRRLAESTAITLASDRSDLTLQVDRDATTPSYLQVTLEEPREQNGRQFWTLKVAVPPGAAEGDVPKNASVVLMGTSKGEPVRVRVPVKGRGYRRGV